MSASGPGQGAELLDELVEILLRYVVLPSDAVTHAVVLWIAATHAQPSWEHATRLVIKSPERRCGKSRLLELIRETAHKPCATVNISAAALVRAIHRTDPPTLLVDEADRLYGSKVKSEMNEDLTGILNGGFARDWPYTRYNAAKGCNEQFPTFAMAALASKAVDLPDTIEDRAVIVMMRRRAPTETVASFRRRNKPELHKLRDRLNEWIQPHLSALEIKEPDLPVEDRAADTWEPLVALADLIGGQWPQRARTACLALSGRADDAVSLGTRLLADLRTVLPAGTGLHTETIICRLCGLPESPWADYFGRRLTPRDLAKLLKPYDVTSKDVREIGTGPQRKGYHADELHDPWLRYLPQPVRDKGDMGDTAGRAVADTEGIGDIGDELPLSNAHVADTESVRDSPTSDVADVANTPPTAHCSCGQAMYLLQPGRTTCERCRIEHARAAS